MLFLVGVEVDADSLEVNWQCLVKLKGVYFIQKCQEKTLENAQVHKELSTKLAF